uniref:Uncharacterized protein n=1 Tax=Glossina palpalis gambiensis TaxID=67801 RepID=A0A1B0C7I6_9MUSC
MAENRSGRVRVVIEIPSVGAKSTQRAAAKNNNLEIVCNVLAAASSYLFSSNELAVPSRKATSASHVPSTTTPEMIKEYVQRGMPEVDVSRRSFFFPAISLTFRSTSKSGPKVY